MKKIAFILFDQFQILDVSGPAQIFSSVNDIAEKAFYEIDYYTANGGPCRSTCGMIMETRRLREYSSSHSLIISGGQGTKTAAEDPTLIHFLKQEAHKVDRLISICTGAYILSEAGLLDGKRVTTHWAYADQLQKKNPKLSVEPDALYIRQGNVITSAGVTAGMDLALSLIEEDMGKEMAREVARYMVIFYRRPGGQSQFSTFQGIGCEDEDPFAPLCHEIITHPGGDYRISSLAEKTHMTERTFTRRFTQQIGLTPAKFVEKARLDNARRALEETRLNLDQIAHEAGFHSPEVLRRSFQRHMAISPREYRERFGG
ncbi:Transcriptional regulator, AraC family [hydrothermal vent metagenome]|uniref:Transcriptional regulator, AraC family n=1 Tax=hydrothermal vent metagenome TaxID=652676 RepID=A0A3B1AYU6_9ZZZZ